MTAALIRFAHVIALMDESLIKLKAQISGAEHMLVFAAGELTKIAAHPTNYFCFLPSRIRCFRTSEMNRVLPTR